MRLLNVIQRYPPAIGGAEVWCQEMSRYLAARGHDVRVVTTDVDREEEYWKDPLDGDRPRALGRFGFDERVSVRRYRRSLPIHWLYHAVYKRILDRRLGIYFYGPHSGEMYGKLWREMRAADVVLLHTLPHPHNLIAFSIARRLDKPVVVVPHFHPGHPFYERRIHYRLLAGSEAVITVSSHEASYLASKGVASDRLHVTGNGIHPEDYRPVALDEFRRDLARRHGLAEEDRLVTFIGRKTPEKGIGDLLTAARRLTTEMPVRFFLAGPRLEWYDQAFAALTPTERERIIDLGVISHQAKVNLLHLSDLLVLPSQFEAFGIVFLEAWACGAPVLGTTEGAMPEVIGEYGFLSKFGDAHDLQEMIREALADRDRSRTRGGRGRERVLERFTWAAMGREVEACLRKTASRRGIRRRIVVCSNAYPPNSIGGAEIVAHSQARELMSRGYDVRVFCGERANHRPRGSLTRDVLDGIPVCRVVLHDEDYSWEFYNFVHRAIEDRFERFLDEASPEVVHFHNPVGLSVGLLHAARRRRAKVVVTLHDYWGICFKNTLLKTPRDVCADIRHCEDCQAFISAPPWMGVPIRLRKDYVAAALEAVDSFLAPSAALAERYAAAGIPRDRLHHVPYGLALERFANVARNADSRHVQFLFAGYLAPHKGIETLLEALPHVRGADRMRLHVVGDGELRALWEERVRAIGFADRVRFWGRIEHDRMADVLAKSDVLVLPSLWPENLPVSIMEAMASGMAVIASRIGGVPELVDEGRTGTLFEPGNARELAARMSEMLDDPRSLPDVSARARQKISGFTLAHEAEAVAAVYENEARAPDPPPGWLVACTGRTFGRECARAVAALPREGTGSWRLVMADWLPDWRLRDVGALWVVDPESGLADVARALAHRLPLLVPEVSATLRDLVIEGRCGLYYANATDAVACLERLRLDEELRAAMGRNAFRLLHTDRRLQLETEVGD